MAKFPKPDDTRDIAGGEILAMTLAAQGGIQVPEHRFVPIGGHSVAVITRFDRAGKNRIPFISAVTLLGLPRGDPGAYTLLADGIRQFGHDVPVDLRELWRRLVFSLLASNYDNHLRNHGFLMREPGRWSLSPAYDINPVPEVDRVRMNKTAIAEDQEEPTIEGALAAAPRFGVKTTEAKKILREVFTAVSGWRNTILPVNGVECSAVNQIPDASGNVCVLNLVLRLQRPKNDRLSAASQVRRVALPLLFQGCENPKRDLFGGRGHEVNIYVSFKTNAPLGVINGR